MKRHHLYRVLGILRQEWNESHKIETMWAVDRAASIVCAKIRSLLTVTITVCLICVLSISSCHALMIQHHPRALSSTTKLYGWFT